MSQNRGKITGEMGLCVSASAESENAGDDSAPAASASLDSQQHNSQLTLIEKKTDTPPLLDEVKAEFKPGSKEVKNDLRESSDSSLFPAASSEAQIQDSNKRPWKKSSFQKARVLKRSRCEGVSIATPATYAAQPLVTHESSSEEESDEDWGDAQTFDERELDFSVTKPKTEDSSFEPLQDQKFIKLRCTQVITSLSLGYGFAITRGDRPQQEDTYIFHNSGDKNTTAYAMAGVFDGHGGQRASHLAQTLFPRYLSSLSDQKIVDNPPECLVAAFKKAADHVASTLRAEDDESGTTAICVLATSGHLAVANAGDCRAVLSRGGVAQDLSCDHTLDLASERARVEKVNPKAIDSNGRLFGVLSVTRSLGDLSFPGLVIPDPEIKLIDLTPNDEFVIVASDGVWGAMTSQQAVNYVRRCAVEENSFDSQDLAKKLMRKAVALKAGDADNVTVSILSFHQSGS